jgi:hypothetical protein
MLTRFTRSPRTTKSSETMLPDKSSAHTMSMPLAFTCVVLFIRRGWASATMNSASASQRSVASTAPARERRPRVRPATSFTDEYKNAGAEPRRPFSHAASGSSNSSNNNHG